jgi:hypothetical protein
MSKLVLFAGYSFKDGSFKFRCANDMKRAGQLEALGDTLVNLMPLPQAMTKAEAAKHLLNIDYANGKAEVEAVFAANVADENPFVKPAKVAKPTPAKKPATVKVKVIKGASKMLVTKPAESVTFNSAQAAKIRAEFMKKLRAVGA